MNGATAIATIALLVSLAGCDNYVEKSKYEDSQRELQQVRTELTEVKKQLQEAQRQINETSAQRFSTYQNGTRTWRFNSATGETCVMLTSESDWKTAKTQLLSCDCQDARRQFAEGLANTKPGDDRKLVIETWEPWIKAVCGKPR